MCALGMVIRYVGIFQKVYIDSCYLKCSLCEMADFVYKETQKFSCLFTLHNTAIALTIAIITGTGITPFFLFFLFSVVPIWIRCRYRMHI